MAFVNKSDEQLAEAAEKLLKKLSREEKQVEKEERKLGRFHKDAADIERRKRDIEAQIRQVESQGQHLAVAKIRQGLARLDQDQARLSQQIEQHLRTKFGLEADEIKLIGQSEWFLQSVMKHKKEGAKADRAEIEKLQGEHNITATQARDLSNHASLINRYVRHKAEKARDRARELKR